MKFILFIIFITLSFIHLDAGDTLKVTTLNIRRSGIDTGEMRWEKRKWILKNYIDYAKSDILCIQEGLLPQINFIDSLLDLEYVGVGRDDIGIRHILVITNIKSSFYGLGCRLSKNMHMGINKN